MLSDNPAQHFEQIPDDLVEIYNTHLENLASAERQHLARQGSTALGCLVNLFRGALMFRIRRQVLGKGAAVTQYDSQKIVEIVCNSAGQSSDGFYFLRLPELAFQFAPLGQVADCRRA